MWITQKITLIFFNSYNNSFPSIFVTLYFLIPQIFSLQKPRYSLNLEKEFQEFRKYTFGVPQGMRACASGLQPSLCHWTFPSWLEQQNLLQTSLSEPWCTCTSQKRTSSGQRSKLREITSKVICGGRRNKGRRPSFGSYINTGVYRGQIWKAGGCRSSQ